MRALLFIAIVLLAKGSLSKEPTIPETPTRESVVQAMSSVTAAVSACAPHSNELVPVRFTFRGSDGQAVDAQITGQTSLTTAERACITRAARSARLPPFRRPDYRVNYPFRLNYRR